jgi:hypothetical protein
MDLSAELAGGSRIRTGQPIKGHCDKFGHIKKVRKSTLLRQCRQSVHARKSGRHCHLPGYRNSAGRMAALAALANKLARIVGPCCGVETFNPSAMVERIIARVEAGVDGPDTRFIVTNLKGRNARALYEDIYCQRCHKWRPRRQVRGSFTCSNCRRPPIKLTTTPAEAALTATVGAITVAVAAIDVTAAQAPLYCGCVAASTVGRSMPFSASPPNVARISASTLSALPGSMPLSPTV